MAIILISAFLIVLISIIIITAVLYHNRKRAHKIAVTDYENALIHSQYEVREQTMQTIGTDLHDNIGQLLSLTSLTLGSIEFDNPDKAKEKVEAAFELTVRSIQEMRSLGKLLQGEQLISNGLVMAIKHEIGWLEKSGKYIIRLEISGEESYSTIPGKDLIIFRILQETLNNTIKHASATFIAIRLNFTTGGLELEIEDNGTGFNLAKIAETKSGMGLLNIRKRAGIIGGHLSIETEPDKGTKIKLFTPYP